MNADKWHQIESLLQFALERAPERRSAFLAEACGDDEPLRWEVESLIATHEQATSFLETPLSKIAKELLVTDQALLAEGAVFGSYKIDTLLGTGGMGVVYLAEDLRLGRRVALKLLPSDFTTDTARLRRFEQEARCASSLNYPNILTIYEFGETDNIHFIACEFIEGATLRERMNGALMKLGAILDVAAQIASALSAAHAAGIVHRDIKPENIMLRRDDLVKVLDFGLATLTERLQSDSADTPAPTLFKTDPDTLVGTAIYMSPEQARGLDVDARTDIWSLGVVLYEMVAGCLPFTGSTSSEVLAFIMSERESQPLNQYSREVPTELEQIISKALCRNRDERYQTIEDMLLDLKTLREDLEFETKRKRSALGDGNGKQRYIETVPKLGYRFVAPVTELRRDSSSLVIQRRIRAHIVKEEVDVPETVPLVPLPAKQVRLGRWMALIALAAIALLTTIIAVRFWRHRTPPVSVESGLRFLTDGRYDDESPSWNNGQIYFFRYFSPTRRESWKMNADGTNQRRANTEIKSLLDGRWSPDGKKVVFIKEDEKTAYLADADGANEIALPSGGNMDWSSDSSQFVYEVRTAKDSAQLFLYTIKTRQNVALTDNQSLNADPSFSPDGKQIVFVSARDKNANIYVMQTDGSNLRRLTDDPYFDNYPVFSPDGTQVAFQSNREDERTQIYLKNFNDDTPPRKLTRTDKDMGIISGCWSPDGSQILLYMSENGKSGIVLADVDPPAQPILSDDRANLTSPRLSADAKVILYEARTSDHTLELRLTDLGTRRTRTIFKSEGDYAGFYMMSPTWSPDNSLIAFSNKVNGNSEIFTIKPDGTSLRNLTNNPLRDADSIFSPDGSEIFFVRDNYGQTQLYRMDLNGGKQRRVTDKPGYEMSPAFSPDGAYLAFTGDRDWHGLDIFLLDLNNPRNEKVIASRRFYDRSPAFSPDGKRMAFIATSDGNQEIYLMNSDGSGMFRLTHTKAVEMTPQFSKDGHSLFYAANRNERFAIYELPLP